MAKSDMPNITTIDTLKKAVGQKLTNFDISDDHTCVVLFFEDAQEPLVINLFSTKEIQAD